MTDIVAFLADCVIPNYRASTAVVVCHFEMHPIAWPRNVVKLVAEFGCRVAKVTHILGLTPFVKNALAATINFQWQRRTTLLLLTL